ncbi:MAG: hypothetical protein QM820_18245 [Minicystis sp.]
MSDNEASPAPAGTSAPEKDEGTAPPIIVAPPIHAAPGTEADRLDILSFWSKKPVIELPTPQILQPYAASGTTTFWDDERKAKFKVTIKAATKTTLVYIRKDSTVINTYRTTTEMLQPGTHDWGWSGFGDNLVFDTEALRQGRLSADVQTDGGSSTSLDLAAKQVYVDWMDLKIDDRAKRVEPKVYVAFANSPVPGKELDPATFARVKGLILAGIGRYWSRRVTVRWPYDVVTTAVERAVSPAQFVLRRPCGAIKFILTQPTPLKNIPGLPMELAELFADQGAGERSFNPGAYRGNDTDPIVFYYDPASPPSAERIQETGAHEFGHSILLRGIDKTVSVTHKGTSTEGQKRIPGAYVYPATGEIDLMKYGTGAEPADFFTRVVATEDDVKALISLGRVELSAR